MFDTMTSTKVIAALCGTFLIFLLGKWAVESVYHVGPAGHGDEHQNAYVIATDDGHGEEETMEEEVDFMTLMASADAGAGERCSRNARLATNWVQAKMVSDRRCLTWLDATSPQSTDLGIRVLSVVWKATGPRKRLADFWKTPRHTPLARRCHSRAFPMRLIGQTSLPNLGTIGG